MTGALFEISAPELARAGVVLTEIERRASALAPALDEIGMMLTTSTRRRFEEGRGPDGTPWIESGRAKAEGGRTLVDRGHLRDSITHRVEGHAVRVGTNRVYGGIHQFGGVIEGKSGSLKFKTPGGGFVTVKSVTMPARPFLGLSDADRAEATVILEEFLSSPLFEGGSL